MRTVVITGSTRGIGLGLARELLARGCVVVVSGRRAETVAGAVDALGREFDGARIEGIACDVTDPGQQQGLWDGAVARFERVDIWINNAGVANPRAPVWEQEPGRLRAVVETNVLGAMLGSSVAIRGMLAQGAGAVYNLEGLGSDGRKVAGLAPYGTSKYAVRYLTDSLASEVAGTGVIVGSIRPGMVLTDMLLDGLVGSPDEQAELRKLYDTLADRVETVTPWIAERVLANGRNGARISWLSGARIALRFALAPFRQRGVLKGMGE